LKIRERGYFRVCRRRIYGGGVHRKDRTTIDPQKVNRSWEKEFSIGEELLDIGSGTFFPRERIRACEEIPRCWNASGLYNGTLPHWYFLIGSRNSCDFCSSFGLDIAIYHAVPSGCVGNHVTQQLKDDQDIKELYDMDIAVYIGSWEIKRPFCG
jgi:hypothetical protein